jgi:hypothetical protein
VPRHTAKSLSVVGLAQMRRVYGVGPAAVAYHTLRPLGAGAEVLASAGLGEAHGIAGGVHGHVARGEGSVATVAKLDVPLADVGVVGRGLAGEEVVAGAPADGLADELGGRE